MNVFLARFFRSESGATAIEYAIIAGGIALAIVSAITALSGSVAGKFDAVNAAVK